MVCGILWRMFIPRIKCIKTFTQTINDLMVSNWILLTVTTIIFKICHIPNWISREMRLFRRIHVFWGALRGWHGIERAKPLRLHLNSLIPWMMMMTRHHCAGRADRHWTFGQSQTENILYSQYSTYSACWWLSQWWWMGNCWDSADHALMSPPPWSLISANHNPLSGAIDQSGVSILAHLSTRILSRSQVSSTYQRWNIFLPTSQFSFGVYSSKWYQHCWEVECFCVKC